MRLCLPARMGGGGKAESLPWSGPAGEARHTGATILLWEMRGQSPWRSRLSGNGAGQAPSAATRHRQRHPCTARRSRAVWRQAKRGQGRCSQGAAPPVTANARAPPDRQGQRRECQRVSSNTPHPQGAQRERGRPQKIPRIFPRSGSSPEGPRPRAWGAQRIERVAAGQRHALKWDNRT